MTTTEQPKKKSLKKRLTSSNDGTSLREPVTAHAPSALVPSPVEVVKPKNVRLPAPVHRSTPGRTAKPLHLSKTENVDLEPARKGAQMLGVSLLPQGEDLASVILSRDASGLPTYVTVGAEMPRRSSKTTAVWAVILGLAATIPNYRVVYSAQDGTRAGQKFREMMRELQARGLDVAGVVNLAWSNGRERITFTETNAQIWVVAPKASSYRSEAADLLVFDEAGELDIETSEDLLAGALPILDTRPMGQAIIVGTPAEDRAGLLWTTLEAGRNGEEGYGICEYAVPDDVEPFTIEEDGTVQVIEEVLMQVHPGVGTLTTMTKMRARLKSLGPEKFAREYLCKWPMSNTASAIDQEIWRALAVPEPQHPEKFGIAFDVEPDSSAAALAVAWRDETGKAFVGIIDCRTGTDWLPGVAHALAKKYRLPIRFDSIGANHEVANRIERMRGVKMAPGSYKDAQGAVATFTEALRLKNVSHFDQRSLNTAAEVASFRQGEAGRLWARKAAKGAMCPLVAAGLALWQFDSTQKSKTQKVIRSSVSR